MKVGRDINLGLTPSSSIKKKEDDDDIKDVKVATESEMEQNRNNPNECKFCLISSSNLFLGFIACTPSRLTGFIVTFLFRMVRNRVNLLEYISAISKRIWSVGRGLVNCISWQTVPYWF